MKVAIIHDWLVVYAGAEKVLEQLLLLYPKADLFSIVDFLTPEQRGFIGNRTVQTSFIQKLPFARSKYRLYLPLMPLAVEQFDLSGYDLVISSSHAVAKGVITGPDQLHISYVHSPIRYAWDLQHQYLKESGLSRGLKGSIAKWILHRIRLWDSRTSNSVNAIVANSQFIANRIWKIYRRQATVIFPPVDINQFQLEEKKQEYYLTASRLVPYKRIDLIVEAFAEMPDKKLIVIGNGPDYAKVKAKAAANVRILGYQPDEVLQKYMREAKAFVFAAEEDFGIMPVEAQASGTPVIAFGKGGLLETIRGLGMEHPTGIFFKEQTVDSIIEAVNLFEKHQAEILPYNCRMHALQFSTEIFCYNFQHFVNEQMFQFTIAQGGGAREPEFDESAATRFFGNFD
jgi:glycosyltransferase involved in cell wall biosynthesis